MIFRIAPEIDTAKFKKWLVTSRDYLVAYKWQIFWMTMFILLQLFLFGMGVLQYFENMKVNQRPFAAPSMLGLAFGMPLQIDCTILIMLPAFRFALAYIRRTRLSFIFAFDSLISFHMILGFTVVAFAIAHTVFFIYNFYK